MQKLQRNLISSTSTLASTYRNQERWREAEGLEVRKRVLGPEHLDTLTSMNNLASTHMNQQRWKESEELEVQISEIRKRVQGPDHPDTLTSMNNLAWTWKRQGQTQEGFSLDGGLFPTAEAGIRPGPSIHVDQHGKSCLFLETRSTREGFSLHGGLFPAAEADIRPEASRYCIFPGGFGSLEDKEMSSHRLRHLAKCNRIVLCAKAVGCNNIDPFVTAG